MGVSWGISAPFIAFVIIVAAIEAAGMLSRAIRERDYNKFENDGEERLSREFPLPSIDSSTAEVHYKLFAPYINKQHKAANVAQARYYNAVVRSAGCLVLAFIALALGTFRPGDWARLDWEPLEILLNWIDVIAIVFVLILFLYGRIASRLWIADRAITELLRQYQFLSLVFPSAITRPRVDDFQTQFYIEADLVAARVKSGSITDIGKRIERFWSMRKASIESCAFTETDLTVDALLVYLKRRSRRQLGWFSDSNARLERVAERRNVVMLILYCVTAGLAVLKHVLFLWSGRFQAFLLPPLLIVTGMSAAMTAYYIHQNSRSLIHRYNSQQRTIAAWLAAFNNRWSVSGTLTIDASAKKEIRTQIVRFEDFMIEELIDWIHITSHDSIELAP
jgi:hypothetical protein